MPRSRRPLAALLSAITALSLVVVGCMSASDSAPKASRQSEGPSAPVDEEAPSARPEPAAEPSVTARADPASAGERKNEAPREAAKKVAPSSPAAQGRFDAAGGDGLAAKDSPGTSSGITALRGITSSSAGAKTDRSIGDSDARLSLRAPMPERDKSVDDEATISHGGGFAAVTVNPWTKASEDSQSTFAIDVDTASYTFARRFLDRGQRPPMGSVRVEEFVNAFHYDYAPPETEPFRVHLAAAPSPLDKRHHLVRVAVKGREVSNAARKPVHLTFLVDTSGSMSAHDKLPLAKDALTHLVDNLRDDDSVALITYAGSTEVVLAQTKVKEKRAIKDAIARLRTGGGTNMGSGMELAYKNAHRFLSSDSESRVVVLSDGDANIGRTSHQAMLEAVKGYVSEGVTLSTVGFGTGNYQDHLMEQLANAGNGNYSYIDSMRAAKKVFGTDLVGTLQVIAKDVKIQVEWNPSRVKRYRLLGYENRDIADRDFRNDRVDAGEIGSGHTVTALYEVELVDDDEERDATLATVRVRAKTPKGVKASESSFTLTGRDVTARFAELDRDTRFAMAVALAGEVLRGSPHAEGFTLDDAYELASDAADGPHKDERQEFLALLGRVAPSAGVAVR